MKFTADQKNLINAINTVAKAIKTRTTVPILTNMLITATEDKVTFTGFDLELGIRTNVDGVQIEEAGTYAVPHKNFLDFVKSMPAGEITISTKDTVMTIQSGRSKMRLTVLDGAEYPKMPEPDTDAVSFDLTSEIFSDCVSRIMYAVGTDMSRAMLTGVHFDASDNNLTVVAIDGFRLALRRTKTDLTDAFKMTVPAQTLAEIIRLCQDGEKVAISKSDKNAIFTVGNTVIYSRLIAQEYVNYHSIVSGNPKTTATFDKEKFLECCERANLVSNTSDRRVGLDIKINNDTCELKTVTETSEFDDILDFTNFSGENVDLTVNSKYLTDTLKNISDKEVVFQFSGATAPVFIKPTEGDAFFSMILPIRR